MTNHRRGTRENTKLSVHRSREFAALRVPAFTATIIAGCGLLALAGACSDASDDGTSTLLDAAPPPPPGACAAARTAQSLCETSASPDRVDAGGEAPDAGDPDAAVPDAGVPLLPPESANLCLVTDDVTITCPSEVSTIATAEGTGDTTHVVLAQVGLGRYASPTDPTLVPDEEAHVQHIHVARDGAATVAMDPVIPYNAAEPLPGGSFALVGATDARDAHLLSFTKDGDGALTLRMGPLAPSPLTLGAPLSVPASVSWRPHVVTGPTGEGMLFALPRSGAPQFAAAGPLVMVRGLPDAPRVVSTSIAPRGYLAAEGYAATVTKTGTPAVLFHDGATLRLREGDDLATERWSMPLEQGQEAIYDVAYSADEPVVLYRDGGAVIARSARAETLATSLGESFSTCPRSSYLGVTCDACPVDQSCHVGRDVISQAKLFTREGRVFAVFLATDERRRMGYARSVVPIIDVGCACTLEERDRQVVGQSLVVVEITPSGLGSPRVTEWMRVPILEAGARGYTWLYPRRDGNVDVVVGAFPTRHDAALTRYPEGGVAYRVLRLAMGLIP